MLRAFCTETGNKAVACGVLAKQIIELSGRIGTKRLIAEEFTPHQQHNAVIGNAHVGTPLIAVRPVDSIRMGGDD